MHTTETPRVSELIGLSQIDSMATLIDHIFSGLKPEEGITKTREFIPEFLRVRNESGMLASIGLIELFLSRKFDRECAPGRTSSIGLNDKNRELLEFYWQVYLEANGMEPLGSLMDVRLKILEKVGGIWTHVLDRSSRRAFGFLAAVFAPRDKNENRESLSREEQYMLGRRVSIDEQGKIEKIVREKLADKFSFNHKYIETWMKQREGDPWLPDDLRKIFELAWVRNGGKLSEHLDKSEKFDALGSPEELLKLRELRKMIGHNLPEWALLILQETARQIRVSDEFLQKFSGRIIMTGELGIKSPYPASGKMEHTGAQEAIFRIAIAYGEYSLEEREQIVNSFKETLKAVFEELAPSGFILRVVVSAREGGAGKLGYYLGTFTFEKKEK